MERMREAVTRARGARLHEIAGPARSPSRLRRDGTLALRDAWAALEAVELDDAVLIDQRIVAWKKTDPAHVAFDKLRTRLLRLMAEQGWRRVLVTSPGKRCGKTVVAANLAMSLARHGAARTLLADLDLGAPRLARRLGLGAVPLSLADWLSSDAPVRSHFIRVGSSLAVCLNTEAVPDSAELLQDARTARRLQEATAALDPTAVVYDLPPMLTTDDALGFLPQVDCVLLVAAAGQTTSEEIEECERLLAGNTHFLGVLLNKAEPPRGGFRPSARGGRH